jgi:hypothetical protein
MSQPARATAPAFASEALINMPEPRTAEGRLMLAVLLDAVALLREDVSGRVQHTRREVRDTLAWIASDDDSWPLSFTRVCAGLGLDPAALRADLARELQACGDRVRAGEVRAFPAAPQGTGAAKDSDGASSR